MEKMNTTYLRRKNKVVVDSGDGSASLEHLATLLKNLETLGYTLSNELLERVSTLSLKDLTSFYTQTVADLKVMVGAHVVHKPMYPNFPQQVMDMSEAELYFNAMMHYFGDWVGLRITPVTDVKEREGLQSSIELKVINLGTREDFKSIFTNLVASNTALSDTDKVDIETFIRALRDPQRDLITPIMPKNIPLRENVAMMAGLFMKYGVPVDEMLAQNIKTATDVLRLAVHLSDGDVSLAVPCKFRNFKRSERRMLLSVLNKCKNITEDMLRYKEQWKRLGERLHPFEKASQHPEVTDAFTVLYQKQKESTMPSSC
jgi:hypothetical protein